MPTPAAPETTTPATSGAAIADSMAWLKQERATSAAALAHLVLHVRDAADDLEARLGEVRRLLVAAGGLEESVRDRGVQAVVLGTDGHLFLDVCKRLNAVKN